MAFAFHIYICTTCMNVVNFIHDTYTYSIDIHIYIYIYIQMYYTSLSLSPCLLLSLYIYTRVYTCISYMQLCITRNIFEVTHTCIRTYIRKHIHNQKQIILVDLIYIYVYIYTNHEDSIYTTCARTCEYIYM